MFLCACNLSFIFGEECGFGDCLKPSIRGEPLYMLPLAQLVARPMIGLPRLIEVCRREE